MSDIVCIIIEYMYINASQAKSIHKYKAKIIEL
jgi:hypothetical protein